MKKILIIMGILLLMPSISSAIPIAIGDPVEGNSWAQRFEETGVGPFDTLEIYMLSDDLFEGPAFRNFSVGGWAETNSGYTFSQAQGPEASYARFDIWFAGDQSNPLVFDFVAWLDDELLEAATASWSGSGWSITASTNTYDAPYTAPVPEPATMLLVVSGIVGLVGLRRRFKRE